MWNKASSVKSTYILQSSSSSASVNMKFPYLTPFIRSVTQISVVSWITWASGISQFCNTFFYCGFGHIKLQTGTSNSSKTLLSSIPWCIRHPFLRSLRSSVFLVIFALTHFHFPYMERTSEWPDTRKFFLYASKNYIQWSQTASNLTYYTIGKAVLLQAWSGPEGSRKLRCPDFMTTAQDGGKVVSLTYRPPLPPGNTPGTHFC